MTSLGCGLVRCYCIAVRSYPAGTVLFNKANQTDWLSLDLVLFFFFLFFSLHAPIYSGILKPDHWCIHLGSCHPDVVIAGWRKRRSRKEAQKWGRKTIELKRLFRTDVQVETVTRIKCLIFFAACGRLIYACLGFPEQHAVIELILPYHGHHYFTEILESFSVELGTRSLCGSYTKRKHAGPF